MANFLKGIGDFFQSLGTGTALDGSGSESFGKEFFTENPLGRTLSAFGIGDMYAQEQQQIDAENRQEQNQIEAEQRANAEYDRRMADERAYNDPAAQAERLRSAGINPMANLGQGVTSSSTKMSAPTQSSPSMSSPRGSNTGGGISSMFQLMTAGEQLKREKLQNDLLGEQVKTERIDQILKMSDVELKKQLYDYNSKANPYLLEGLQKRNEQATQDLKNSKQEYENLVKSGEATDQQIAESKQRVAESKQRVLESQANILLIQAREKNIISDTAYRKALTATEGWNTKKAEEEYNIAKIDFDSKEVIYDALYASGAFKDMTENDRKKSKALADLADAQFEQFKSIWGSGDTNLLGDIGRIFLYLLTNIFSGSISHSFK